MRRKRAKQLATKEDIENVLEQVRAVTRETEFIRADIQGAVWQRQMAWTQKRDIYAELLRNANELQSVYVALYSATGPFKVTDTQEIDEINRRASGHASEMRNAYALALIFVIRETCEAVKAFIENPDDNLTRPEERAGRAIEKLERLRDAIVDAVRKDLGL